MKFSRVDRAISSADSYIRNAGRHLKAVPMSASELQYACIAYSNAMSKVGEAVLGVGDNGRRKQRYQQAIDKLGRLRISLVHSGVNIAGYELGAAQREIQAAEARAGRTKYTNKPDYEVAKSSLLVAAAALSHVANAPGVADDPRFAKAIITKAEEIKKMRGELEAKQGKKNP